MDLTNPSSMSKTSFIRTVRMWITEIERVASNETTFSSDFLNLQIAYVSPSGKHHVHLWTSLTSLQRRKDAKDAKKPRLSKVTFLSLQRHFTSFKDGGYLSKTPDILSKMLIYLNTHIFVSVIVSLSQ